MAIRDLKRYWKPEWYVRVYEMARDGMHPKAVREALGISDYLWRRLWGALPALRDAALKGREARKSVRDGDGSGMPAYVYRHLPPELHKVWKELERVFDVEDHPESFVEGIMTPYGTKARKALYLHALVCSRFDGSQACRKVGVSSSSVAKWCGEDKEFARLINSEVGRIKADFVEGCVFKLIDRGDVTTTLWAAKCLLKDRGYRNAKDDDRSKVAEAVEAKLELDKLTVEELRQLLSLTRPKYALPPKEVSGEVVDSETVLSQEQ